MRSKRVDTLRAEYPKRPKMSRWVRYLLMAFGIANIAGVIFAVDTSTPDISAFLAAFLIGGAWFAFGLYGGFPLVNTVRKWRAPATPKEINDMHRRGLLVMRRRRWITWGLFPVCLTGVLLLWAVLGNPMLAVLVVGVAGAIINLRYMLSRCPRCGYGFFARSVSRAAGLWPSRACHHCGLSLYAYKER